MAASDPLKEVEKRNSPPPTDGADATERSSNDADDPAKDDLRELAEVGDESSRVAVRGDYDGTDTRLLLRWHDPLVHNPK